MKLPKKLWIRSIANNKISVAEYIRNRRHNIVEPFKFDDREAIENLRVLIKTYKMRVYRGVEAVASDDRAKEIAKKLDLTY